MVTFAAASWGLWSLVVRPTGLPATVTGPITFLAMGLAALLMSMALREPRPVWDRTSLALVVANAAFNGLNMLAYFSAFHYTTVAIAVLTHYLAPVLVAVAAPWVDRVEAPGARPAAAVALAGLVIILEPWHAPADGAVIGAALGVVSAVFYAANVFVSRRAAARVGVARSIALHGLIGGAAMAPLAAGHLSEITAGDVALLSIGSTTIGAATGVLFVVGLLRIGSARAAVLTFIEPVVAVVMGALVWHEPIRPVALVGGALVLGAGIQVARKAR